SRALAARGLRQAFTAKWPRSLVATNLIAGHRMTAGTDVSTSGRWLRSEQRWDHAERNKPSKIQQRVLMGRLVDQMASTNGSTMKNSLFLRIPPRSFLQLVSRLLPKIQPQQTRRPLHGFFSDLIS